MLVRGELSGIQEYLFDVAQEGGRQARHLRARSFCIQLIAECAALQIRRALHWPPSTVQHCGAGHFVLEGAFTSESIVLAIQEQRKRIEEWLLSETGGVLRFSLAWIHNDKSIQNQDEFLIREIQREKLRSWSAVAIDSRKWLCAKMILPPLDTPCSFCHRRPATNEEIDTDRGTSRKACNRCMVERRLGGILPSARWLLVHDSSPVNKQDIEIFGLGLSVERQLPNFQPSVKGVIQISNLDNSQQLPTGIDKDIFASRRLARYIPFENNRPVEFAKIAERARGDSLLGILKMDADSLGLAFQKLGASANDFSSFSRLSNDLDYFFAVTLSSEMKRCYKNTYTVFSGGDDLLLLGPWNEILEFAGHVRTLFNKKFKSYELTISAGICLANPKQPIKNAAVVAEELLEKAKTDLSDNAPEAKPKDQCAALGQIWKWEHHQTIIDNGLRLADWIENNTIQRGWIQTLLRLVELRFEGDLLATARLSYQIERNWPKVWDKNQIRAQARVFANQLVNDLDTQTLPSTKFFPAIARFALTATRVRGERL